MIQSTDAYICKVSTGLSHWSREKMAAISQRTFSNAFSSTKIIVFWLQCHWNMFARVRFTVIQHGLFNRLFRRRSKKISKLRVTGLCEENPPVTSGFPSQRASNAENVSIWWRHHAIIPSMSVYLSESRLWSNRERPFSKRARKLEKSGTLLWNGLWRQLFNVTIDIDRLTFVWTWWSIHIN